MDEVSAAQRKRRERDIAKLFASPHQIDRPKDDELVVGFVGPADTPYAGGAWTLRLYLPAGYPFKSPSIGFVNKIFHPNIDFHSGSICLDVINQTWTPMYELCHIFDVFLPQLLAYPNPADPLNSEAAALLSTAPALYLQRVRLCIELYARPRSETAAEEQKRRRLSTADDSALSGQSQLSDLSENEDVVFESDFFSDVSDNCL